MNPNKVPGKVAADRNFLQFNQAVANRQVKRAAARKTR